MEKKIVNEAFHIDEDYYADMDSFVCTFDEQEINDLDDDWAVEAYECESQPIHVFTPENIIQTINEERFSENNAEDEYERIIKILSDNIDFEKLNSLIPHLNYGTRKKFLITKHDLLEYIS